jgi:iron complex outermembrane receptor protein
MELNRTLGVLGLAALLPLAAGAQGQSVSSDQEVIHEIIVTATKRATSLQDVPFSVAAPTEDQLREAGAESIVDVARNVAGFTVADLGPGQSQMAIRGISAGQVIRDQPGVKEQVGVYLDETPISVALFTPDLELFDLDRFEVLRGPQGTLFGAGSEAGTVRYITRQPQLNKFEAITDASFEELTHGDEGGSVRGAVNVPLGGMAAARAVVYYHHLPGFIDAIQPGGGVRKAVNDGERTGGRLSFLIKPLDALSITPRLMWQNLRTNGYPRVDLYNILANPYTTTQPPVTIGDRQQYTQFREGLNDDFFLTDLRADYDFGPFALTSITSYTNRRLLVLRDASQLTGSITFDIFGDVPQVRDNAPLYDHTHLNVFSEEVRLASEKSDVLQWLVGTFYQHIGRRYGQALPVAGYDALTGTPSPTLNAPPDTAFYSNLAYRLRQYAFFGEATWRFLDHWSLTGGLRYYNYKEERTLLFGGFFVGPPVPGQTVDVFDSTSSNGVSPRAIVTYKLTEDMQFNLQASRGFRLGGINDPINRPLCSPQDLVVFGNQKNWRDEKTWNYEIDAKTRWLDHRITLNLSAFYADIKDLQATTTAGTCSSRIVFNVPTARSTGVEAEVFAKPTPNWDLGLSATWLDSKLTSSVVSTLPGGSTVVVGGLADGARLPTAPKVQAVGYLGYSVPVMTDRSLFANATVQYVGTSFSQFENEEPNFGVIGTTLPNAARLIPYGGPLTVSQITFDPQLPSYVLANLRAGLKSDQWEVAAYINNVADKTARLALDYERGRSARVGYLTNQPRTYGLYGRYSF